MAVTYVPSAWAELIEGLSLMSRHLNNMTSPLHCEHDTLYVMADPEAFSEEELNRLDALGFFPDANGVCFQSFRFGSA